MSELGEVKLKEIRISELINDLKSGITRYKKEDLGFGSIEEKYSLTFTELRQIIAHPKLKGIRVSIPSYILIDDTEDQDEDTEVSENTVLSVAAPVFVAQEEEPIQLAHIKIVEEVKAVVTVVAPKKVAVPFI